MEHELQPFSFVLLYYINLPTYSLNVLIVLSVNLISFPFESVPVSFVYQKTNGPPTHPNHTWTLYIYLILTFVHICICLANNNKINGSQIFVHFLLVLLNFWTGFFFEKNKKNMNMNKTRIWNTSTYAFETVFISCMYFPFFISCTNKK